MDKKSGNIIILFDDVCALCNSSINLLEKNLENKYYKYIPSQSDIGKEYIEQYNLGKITDDSLVVIKNGSAYAKADAVLELIDDLLRKWKFLNIFRLLPKKLRDSLYEVISKNRHKWFGKFK